MDICQRPDCRSPRLAYVTARSKDMCTVKIGRDGDPTWGYTPGDMNIDNAGGDYVAFVYCLQCGQMQAAFPLPPCQLEM